MKASLNWLQDYVTLPQQSKTITTPVKTYSIEQSDVALVAEILTRQGLEVESTTHRGNGFDTVVVGKILKAEPHPDANKLQVCQVQVGERALQIVCGAPNARPSLYVAVALPGSKLPGNLEIKVSTIRGVESNGMLCSRAELGLPVLEIDGEGIWELEKDEQGGIDAETLEKNLGRAVFDALNMRDVILDLSITPNRPDCLYHEGLARELFAGLQFAKRQVAWKHPTFQSTTSLSAERLRESLPEGTATLSAGNVASITVHNEVSVPVFFVVMKNVNVTSSPSWLRTRLESLDQPSINNVVDISNYLLLGMGQPSHAFDMSKLARKGDSLEIAIRAAKQNEQFLALDGKDKPLDSRDHVVADSHQVHALLGVMGGEHSKVTTQTKEILIEFANAQPVTVRRTSRRQGRFTDAAFLFEKGIDTARRVETAAEYIGLLARLSPQSSVAGSVASLFAASEQRARQASCVLTSSSVRTILGLDLVSFPEQQNILKSLGFKIQSLNAEEATVIQPSWRQHDGMGEADLAEEIGRIVGLDAVAAAPFLRETRLVQDDPHLRFLEDIQTATKFIGFTETASFHFMKNDDWEALRLAHASALGEPIVLMNPIIQDQPLLQTSLLPDLLRKARHNLGYGAHKCMLYACARTYQNQTRQGDRVFSNNAQSPMSGTTALYDYAPEQSWMYSQDPQRPAETPRLAGIALGSLEDKTWLNAKSVEWDLHTFCGRLKEVLLKQQIHVTLKELPHDHPLANSLHPHKRAGFYVMLHGKEVCLGWAGAMHPAVARAHELDGAVFAFEWNLSIAVRAAQEKHTLAKRARPPKRFQNVSRDFAFVFSKSTKASEIYQTVHEALQSDQIRSLQISPTDVRIFDIYTGANLPADRQSIAFKVNLEPMERTLTDKEIDAIHKAIVNQVQSKLGAELRG